MASAAVQAVPELLEMILFELPPRDLLLAQIVCRHFQSIIKSSKKLQRVLFFEPVAHPALKWSVPRDNDGHKLLMNGKWSEHADEPSHAVYKNPLLSTLFDELDDVDTPTSPLVDLLSSWAPGRCIVAADASHPACDASSSSFRRVSASQKERRLHPKDAQNHARPS